MIPLNDFVRRWTDIGPGAMRVFERVGAAGRYILGPEVEAFESALASTWGMSHAVGVANGLDALQIGLELLGVKPGDRVLTTPLSAFAPTLAIVRVGGVPVFADVDEFGLLDLDRVEEILDRRADIRFLLAVHLYGYVLDLDRLRAIGSRCRMIEDCAQSIGTQIAGGLAATSFYPTKNLGALGDAGALLTNDPAMAERARALRNYGETGKHRQEYIGYNSRLDELQAALLREVMLPHLPRWTAARRRIAARYLDGIRNPHLTLPGARRYEPCWHLFPVLVPPDRRAEFRAHMEACGVLTGEHYPVLIPHQPALQGVRYEIEGTIECAESFSAREVSLPVHPYLLESEVEHVIQAANSWKKG